MTRYLIKTSLKHHALTNPNSACYVFRRSSHIILYFHIITVGLKKIYVYDYLSKNYNISILLNVAC